MEYKGRSCGRKTKNNNAYSITELRELAIKEGMEHSIAFKLNKEELCKELINGIKKMKSSTKSTTKDIVKKSFKKCNLNNLNENDEIIEHLKHEYCSLEELNQFIENNEIPKKELNKKELTKYLINWYNNYIYFVKRWYSIDTKYIKIVNTKLTSIPNSIVNFTKLEELELVNNELTSLPNSIDNLTNLRRLRLYKNEISSIPNSIVNFTKLEKLELGNNGLTSLPREIDKLTNLEELELGNNVLTSLPREIGKLTNLEDLDLLRNQLTSIPKEIGNLTNLVELNLSYNKLTSLPKEIGNLTNLENLYLSDNKLTSIPKSIGKLVYLEYLVLDNNKLTSLPDELSILINLNEINFEVDDNVIISDKIIPDKIIISIDKKKLEDNKYSKQELKYLLKKINKKYNKNYKPQKENKVNYFEILEELAEKYNLYEQKLKKGGKEEKEVEGECKNIKNYKDTYNISRLICGEFHYDYKDVLLKENSCNTISAKIANSLIRIAATRIFSDPFQSILEIPVNSIDSYTGRNVGKFGMGFFSFLYWLVGHPERSVTIESTYKKKVLCTWKIEIKESRGMLIFKFINVKQTNKTGTKVVLNLNKLDDDDRSAFLEQLSKLNDVDDVKIQYRNSLKGKNEIINVNNQGKKTNTIDIILSSLLKYVSIQDYAKGISLKTLLGSLLVPSISTKTIKMSGGEIELKVGPKTRIEENTKFEFDQSKFIITVGNIVVVKLTYGEISPSYNTIIDLPLKMRLPVSRDDVLINTENEKKILNLNLAKLLEITLTQTKNYDLLYSGLKAYYQYTQQQSVHQVLSNFFIKAGETIDKKGYLFIPMKHQELYNSLINTNKFIISKHYEISKIEEFLDKNIKSDSKVFFGKKVIISNHGSVGNGGLNKYLFVSKDYINSHSGWEDNLPLSYEDDVLYPYKHSYGQLNNKEIIKIIKDYYKLGDPLYTIDQDNNFGEEINKEFKLNYEGNNKFQLLVGKYSFLNGISDEDFMKNEFNIYLYNLILQIYNLEKYFNIYNIQNIFKTIFYKLKLILYLSQEEKLNYISNIYSSVTQLKPTKFTYGTVKKYLHPTALNASFQGAISILTKDNESLIANRLFPNRKISNGIYLHNVYTSDPNEENYEKIIEYHLESEKTVLNYLKGWEDDGRYPIFKMELYIGDPLVSYNKILIEHTKSFHEYSVYITFLYLINDNKLENDEEYIKYILQLGRNRFDEALYKELFKSIYIASDDYFSEFGEYIYIATKIYRAVKEKRSLQTLKFLNIDYNYNFKASTLINYVFNNDFDDFFKQFAKIDKYQVKDKVKLQIIEIAINEGTNKPFLESVLTELTQNTLDAIRILKPQNNNLYISTLKDENVKNSLILQFKDFVGIGSKGLLSMMIPFLSTKSASDIATGEMGSGFFNVYRESYKVQIFTRKGTDKIIIEDTPVKQGSRIVDLNKKISHSKVEDDPNKNGTLIAIYTKYETEEELNEAITRINITATQILALINTEYIKIHLNSSKIGKKTSLIHETEDFEMRYGDGSFESYIFTKGVPFISMYSYFYNKNIIDDFILKKVRSNIILNIKQGSYTPVQSRTSINIPQQMLKKFVEFIETGIYYYIIKLINNDRKKGKNIDSYIDNFSSTANANQLQFNKYNYKSGAISTFILNYPIGYYNELVGNLNYGIRNIMKKNKYNEVKDELESYIKNRTENQDIIDLYLGWFKNKNADIVENVKEIKVIFKEDEEEGKNEKKYEKYQEKTKIELKMEELEIFKRFFNIFVNEFWKIGYNLQQTNKIKGTTFIKEPPKTTGIITNNNVLGSYDNNNHEIKIAVNKINLNGLLDFDKILKDEIKFEDFFTLKNNSFYKQLFGIEFPSSTIIHELSHAWKKTSHTAAHTAITLTIGGESKKFEFDVAANKVYSEIINNDLYKNIVKEWNKVTILGNEYSVKFTTKLDISNNLLTSLPESIGKLTNLKELDISYNKLTSLPESIGNLTRLDTLDITYNRLTSLPESIGKLIGLDKLYIIYNKLTSLPESIGNLTRLDTLDISNNKLTSLPKSIGKLTGLDKLYISNNKLTSLPESIGNLTNLKELDISYNKLTSLPKSIGKLTRLYTLKLQNNELTSLPESIYKLKNLINLYLDTKLEIKIRNKLSRHLSSTRLIKLK